MENDSRLQLVAAWPRFPHRLQGRKARTVLAPHSTAFLSTANVPLMLTSITLSGASSNQRPVDGSHVMDEVNPAKAAAQQSKVR